MKKATLSLFLLFIVSACTATVTPNNSPSASPSSGKVEEKVVTPAISTPVISGGDYRSKILSYYKCYLTKNGAMSGYKAIEDAYNTYPDKTVEGVYNALVASNKINDTGCPL